MPWQFEIEGDWDDKTQAYDAKPKHVKLDDSQGPKREAISDLVSHPLGRVEKKDGGLEKNGEDEVRLRQLEASMQELFRKIRALEQRLGVSRDD